jgi:DNA topoisomerase-1
MLFKMQRLKQKLERIGSDPKYAARAVGLRYLADSTPGYYRKKAGRGFSYYDKDSNKVTDKALLERFKKLVIPPAYSDVWISPYENGHLQFTGIDAAGRKQYRYHPLWSQIRNQTKYYRMNLFAEYLPAIRERIEKDLRRPRLDYYKVLALVVRLMELTHIRVGNDAYQKLYGSFGLTTLRDRHARINGTHVYFKFKGKKGLLHDVALHSRKLARLVKQCRDIPGQELFQYYDPDGNHHSIGSGDVNAYLKEITGEDFTAKDFRTWAGSVHALYGLKAAGGFENMSECRKKIVQVLDGVAGNLGNTRAVCKKYYVHPTLLQSYEEGRIFNYLDKLDDDAPLEPRGLNVAEEILVDLLQNERIA